MAPYAYTPHRPQQLFVEYGDGEKPKKTGNLGQNGIPGWDTFLILVLSVDHEINEKESESLLDYVWYFRHRPLLLLYPENLLPEVYQSLQKIYSLNNWSFQLKSFEPLDDKKASLAKYLADTLNVQLRLPIQRVESQSHAQSRNQSDFSILNPRRRLALIVLALIAFAVSLLYIYQVLLAQPSFPAQL